MTPKPAWYYDELKHCGVDYADPQQAAVYDEKAKGDIPHIGSIVGCHL